MRNKEPRKYKIKQCDRGWFTLKKIEAERDVRYCDSCDKCVHWCNTEAQLIEAVNNNWCVATENRLVYTDDNPRSINAPVKEVSRDDESYQPIRLGYLESTYVVDSDLKSKPENDLEDFEL